MNATHFNRLSKSAKIDTIINHAEIISEIGYDDIYTSLFVLNNLLIEMRLHVPSNVVHQIRVVNISNKLYKYVQDLNINSLIEVKDHQ